MNWLLRYLRAFTSAVMFLALAQAPAWAQEITLKAVNAFPEGTYYARNFERFVQKVNDMMAPK